MYTEWKVKGNIGLTNRPVLVAKIRTEHEIIFSIDTFEKIKQTINILRDSEIVELREDNRRVVKDFEKMVDLYHSIADTNFKDFQLINSEWQKFEGNFSLEALVLITKHMLDFSAVRLEGNPENGLLIVINLGIDMLKIEATEINLERIKVETDAIISVSTTIPPIVSATAAVVVAAIQIWKLYREEQDRAAKNEQAAREAAYQDRMEKQLRDCGRVHTGGSGGPAGKDALERIGRVC